MDVAPAIGIDLGTTYSCAAVFRKDKHEIIQTHTGKNTMASYVSYTKNGRIIGDDAKENVLIDPTTTIFGVKRFIGRRFNDEALQNNIENYPFEIINENDSPKIKITYKDEDKILSPEEVSAVILQKIKENAEKHFEKTVNKAVITVPAHFNDSQRQATRDAGKIAGLEVLRIINEPTAAALAYGIDKKYKNKEELCNILVYDFGGGTFDVSIISIDDGIFEVKSTIGNTYLGGDDIDIRLVNHFAQEFYNKYQKDLKTDRRALRRLRLQCEKLKRTLSTAAQASIDIDGLCDGHDFYGGITRSNFENLCSDIFEETLEYVEQALKDAKLQKNDINEVILVGGTTRVPKVREMVYAYFDNKELNVSLNPDEAIAIGASIQAAILDGNPENSEIIGSLLLMDVSSLSLGIEVIGGIMSDIIPRNSQIPTKKIKGYETAHDYQTTVAISIFEGERNLVRHNTLLGKFSLTGIQPAKRGEAKIDVTFEINTDGILHVTAVETKGKIQKELSILMDKNRLSDDEIARMIQEAQIFRREDARWETIVQARLNLERYCSDTKRRIKEELVKFITEEHRQIIEVKCNEALKWAEKYTDLPKEEYETKQKEVYNVCNPIIKIYL